MSYKSSATIAIGEVEMTIAFKYWPGDPGRTYGPPERCYPPEPPEVEIDFDASSLTLGDRQCPLGDLYDLFSDAVKEEIEVKLSEAEYDRARDGAYDREWE